ncbi:hypothetical protein [Enterococcus mundtii]|uniref:Cadherin domain-containing protein n=1 Tax=Enterococcus mundtii TaxID=53346 RepID=A0A848N0Y6_ENTMU|nr:hypothetical protein [Enterococcus mundtii]NMP59589.1 hypothetical protein [Enterococcus mundtii]
MKKRKTMCQLMLLGLTVSTMMVPVSHVSAAIQSVEKSKGNDSLQTSQLNQSLLGSITSDQEQINRLDQKYELVAYDATVLPEKIDSKSLLVAADAKVVDEEGETLSGFTPYVKATTVEAKPGEYQLTVGLKEDASVEKTVKIIVLNEKQEETKYTILAEDVTVLVGQTAADYILKVAGAYARNEKGELFDVIVKSSNVENQLGEYEMTLGIKEDPRVERTIKVTVSDKESYVFSAQDATVMVGQTDEASIISAANVEITNQRGEAVDAKAVIKSSTVQDFPGTYLATIAVDQDMTIEKTITVTVMQANEDTVGQPNYQLLAEDTIVSIGQTDEQSLIATSGAYAIDATTGKVGQVVVKQSTVQNTPGEYDVTFGVVQDASIEKKVKITVQNPEDQPKYHLNVLEKNITLQVGQTDEATILWASGAEVKDQDGYLTYEAKPIIKSSTVENKAGVYKVTLGISQDSTIEKTVNVTVEGEETEIPNFDYFVIAEDAEVMVGQTDDYSLLLATNAYVFNQTLGKQVVPIIKHSTVKDTPGEYEVTIGLEQDERVEKTVKITVVGEQVPQQEYILNAADAAVTVGQTNDQSILAAVGATVTDLSGQPVDARPVIKASTVKDEVGYYEVTIGIDKGDIEKTVEVIVRSENLTEGYTFLAEDAVITAEEIDDASIIKATNARTVYSDGKVVKGAVIKENNVLPIPGEYEVVLMANQYGFGAKTVKVTVVAVN